MAILSSELKFYKSVTVNDTTSNGGVMSANQVISGVVNNFWPNLTKAERDAGLTRYRKLFCKVGSNNDDTFIAPLVWDDLPTAGDDYIAFHVGTKSDTQSAITGSERIYGVGSLNTTVVSGGSTIIVDVENAALTGIFQDTDQIRITDKAEPDSSTGNEQFMTISGAPSVSGTEVTITTAETLNSGYTAGTDTRIMSIYEGSDLNAASSGWTETSTSGTYDESSYPLIMNNIGTTDETVTITFTDASNYTAVGSVTGTLGSGTLSGDFSPTNADFTVPYFTLESGGWGGTWATGETIVFAMTSASIPIWLKLVAPASTSSFANNKNTTVLAGQG